MRKWGNSSEHNETLMYILALGGTVVALLAVLGAIYLVDIVRSL
jgi:hypothetical protein